MMRSAGLIIAVMALVAIAFFVLAVFLRRRRVLCAVAQSSSVFMYISVMRCDLIHACEHGQPPDTWIIYSEFGHGM